MTKLLDLNRSTARQITSLTGISIPQANQLVQYRRRKRQMAWEALKAARSESREGSSRRHSNDEEAGMSSSDYERSSRRGKRKRPESQRTSSGRRRSRDARKVRMKTEPFYDDMSYPSSGSGSREASSLEEGTSRAHTPKVEQIEQSISMDDSSRTKTLRLKVSEGPNTESSAPASNLSNRTLLGIVVGIVHLMEDHLERGARVRVRIKNEDRALRTQNKQPWCCTIL